MSLVLHPIRTGRVTRYYVGDHPMFIARDADSMWKLYLENGKTPGETDWAWRNRELIKARFPRLRDARAYVEALMAVDSMPTRRVLPMSSLDKLPGDRGYKAHLSSGAIVTIYRDEDSRWKCPDSKFSILRRGVSSLWQVRTLLALEDKGTMATRSVRSTRSTVGLALSEQAVQRLKKRILGQDASSLPVE